MAIVLANIKDHSNFNNNNNDKNDDVEVKREDQVREI